MLLGDVMRKDIMRKSVYILIVATILSSLPLGIADENPTVVCTTTTLETCVKVVGGERITVVSLVQPGICPAFFDIKPSDVYTVNQASLILYGGIEPWLEDLITSSKNENVKKVLLEGEWNTPNAAIEMIKETKKALSEIYPQNAEYFEENASSAIKNLRETENMIKEEAKTLDVKNTDVICMQWQKSFVEWLGFNVVATYGPPERLSMKDVNEIIQKGDTAVLVIDNLQSGTKLGSQVASEIGARHVVLTNFPGAVPGTESFSEMIEYNATQLFNAVKAYRTGEKSEKNSYALEIALLALIVLIGAVVFYTRRK